MLRKMTLQAGFAAALIFGAAAIFAQAHAAPAQRDSTENNRVQARQMTSSGTGYRTFQQGPQDRYGQGQQDQAPTYHQGGHHQGQQADNRPFDGRHDRRDDARHDDARHDDGHHHGRDDHRNDDHERSRQSQQSNNGVVALIMDLVN
jgi:hypothetical protein